MKRSGRAGMEQTYKDFWTRVQLSAIGVAAIGISVLVAVAAAMRAARGHGLLPAPAPTLIPLGLAVLCFVGAALTSEVIADGNALTARRRLFRDRVIPWPAITGYHVSRYTARDASIHIAAYALVIETAEGPVRIRGLSKTHTRQLTRVLDRQARAEPGPPAAVGEAPGPAA
jgi:hypothetical protein